jgi:hypothetical protein
MPLKSFQKEIDGVVYEVGQFPAREAGKILTALGGIIGPSLGQLGGEGEPKENAREITSFLDIDIGIAAIGRAIATLFSRLTEDRVNDLVFRMLQTTRILADDGGAFGDPKGEALYDVHFAGRLSSVIKLIVFVVEVNYADFFGIRDIGSLTDKILDGLKSRLGNEKSTQD